MFCALRDEEDDFSKLSCLADVDPEPRAMESREFRGPFRRSSVTGDRRLV